MLVTVATLLSSFKDPAHPAAPAHPTAALDAPVAVVRAFYAALNRHDLEGMAALYAPDAFIAAPGFDARRRGPHAVRARYAGYFASVPDAREEVRRLVRNGRDVVVECRARGTHAPLDPAAPAGVEQRAFVRKHCRVFEVLGGRITRDVTYADPLSFWLRLGLVE